MEAEVLIASGDEIGEGPTWRAGENALYWVDCVNRRLRRFGPGDFPWAEWRLARMPGSFAFRRDGTVLLASRNALSIFDPATGADTLVPTPPVDFARERFNDGAVDRAGRFWVGSMERTQSRPEGGLFCVEPDLSIRKVDGGITVANGICWSPDGGTMFFADSRAGILAYDFDVASGSVANRRLHLPLHRMVTFPDGCTTDAEGGLWVAEPGSGAVHRYDSDCKRERSLALPAAKPASCTFGGPGLGTLFITTIGHRLESDPADWTPGLADGAVLHAEPGVAGLPEPPFGG